MTTATTTSYFRGKLASNQSTLLSPKIEGNIPTSLEDSLQLSSKLIGKDISRRSSPSKDHVNDEGILSSFRSPEQKKNLQESTSIIGSPINNNNLSIINANSACNNNNTNILSNAQNCSNKRVGASQAAVTQPGISNPAAGDLFNGKKILVANYLREKYNNEPERGAKKENHRMYWRVIL